MRRGGPIRRRGPSRARIAFKTTVLERCERRCEVTLDGYRCMERATQAHHVLPLGRGGNDDPGNGLGVCAVHHGWIHAHPDESVLRGYLKHSWDTAHVRLVAR